MPIQHIIYILGVLISILGVSMLIPAGIDWYYGNQEWKNFLFSGFITLTMGGIMVLSASGAEYKASKKEIFLLIPLSWAVLPFFAAIPFYTGGLGMSFTDAYFEATSGVTTTGATVLNDLDTLLPGVLIWRSLLQWIGGVGIVIMVSGVLPIMQVGGMQLLKLEFDPRMEKALPRTAQLSLMIVLIYSILTILCAFLYGLAGMTAFDALNHAMTTISTGGYSTHDASMGFFNNKIIIISTVFMGIASLPFVLIITSFRGEIKSFFTDIQLRWFLLILGIIISIMVLNNTSVYDSLGENIIQTAFNVTSVMTGTGYATTDYNVWAGITVPLLLIAMMLGGGAGSTTCGFKMFRLKILYETVRSHFRSLINPGGIFPSYYGSTVIKPTVSIAVISYLTIFFLSVFVFAMVFSALGYDLVTSMSAAVSALACIGPGLGDVIGPVQNYSTVSEAFKWVFTVGMILGRLEIITVLMLFTPSFWND